MAERRQRGSDFAASFKRTWPMTFKDWNEAYQAGENVLRHADAAHAARKQNGHSYHSEATSQSFTAAELQRMDFPPINFVVPGYIVEGLTLLAGKPKFGKSWLVLHVGIAVSSGGYTLQRGDHSLAESRCKEGDVLYCALEDNPRRLKRRVRKLLKSTPW